MANDHVHEKPMLPFPQMTHDVPRDRKSLQQLLHYQLSLTTTTGLIFDEPPCMVRGPLFLV